MKSSTKKIIFLVLVLSIVAIGLTAADSYNLLSKPKNIFYFITSPWQKAFSLASLKTNQTIRFFLNIRQIAQENHELRVENLNLTSQISQLNQLIEENKVLRQALDFQESPGQKIVMARIISRAALADRDVVMIDKGANHGILKDMAVVRPPDILLGKVIASLPNFSFFLPLTSYQSQIQALVQEGGASGMLKGQDSRLLLMEMIPQDKELKTGDLVMTAANLNIVSSLLIGRLTEIKRTDLGVFQKALVKPLVDLADVNLVAVIISDSSNLEGD